MNFLNKKKQIESYFNILENLENRKYVDDDNIQRIKERKMIFFMLFKLFNIFWNKKNEWIIYNFDFLNKMFKKNIIIL